MANFLKKLWNNVVKPVAAVAAIIYTGGLAAAAVGGGVLGAAITFGSRVLAAVTVSKMMTKPSETPGANESNVPPGNRFQAGPSLTNKLPVVYGNAYMPGILTDAVISTDQKYMWFVYAISEVTNTGTFTFDDPNNVGYPLAYWNDKQMIFDATDRTKVIAFRDNSVSPYVDDTKVSGKVYCYFYRNGSANPLYGAPNAITVMSDSVTGGGIGSTYRWTSTDVMSNTAFMIVRIEYDQNASLTSIGNITSYIQNSLYQPGSVAVDYLTNTRYGCGVPVNLVDIDAFTGTNGLNDYSAEFIDFNDGAGVAAQARYKINGPLDTARNCMDNLNAIMDACDSWLKWDETYGKWSVIINRSYSQAGLDISDLFAVYADTIQADTGSNVPASNFAYTIGGITITPTDLNNTYNRFEVQFPSKLIKDQTDYAYINLPSNLINPNEPINNAILQLPLVNDSVQAQYIGTRRLAAARDDLIVAFNTDYGGIQVEAGDIIRVYHDAYGWSANYYGFENGKLFRVTQVQETKDDAGNLIAYIVASEYNDSIYGDNNITAFQPSPNTGLTDPSNISTPNAPVIVNVQNTGAVPSFDVLATVPLYGTVTAMEFWYCLAVSPPTDTSQFKLWSTQYYSSGPIFPSLASVIETVSGLPAAPSGFTYYWRIRAAGTRSKSDFSPNSGAQSWNPNPTATVTGQNFQASYQPNPISVSLYSNGQANLASFTVKLYGLSGPGQVDYTDANSNANMANSSWRIDIPNISYSGIAFSGDPFDGGTYAEWPSATSMTSNVATISTPIIYKDSTGNTYNAPPAILSLSKQIPGQTGSRGVVTLAYVPVTYDPTYGTANATDANLSASFASTTGFSPPINNDGAMFINETLDIVSARIYDDTATPYKWKSAVLQVPGQAISNNSISTGQIKAGTITAAKIAANAITANSIAANAITANSISANAVTAGKIAAGAVTATTIAANAITSNSIAANAITAGKIAANAVTASEIAAGSIDASKLQAFTITAGQIAAGTIDATRIAANTIRFENLVIGAVQQSKSTISDPIVQIQPWSNPVPQVWPTNTRTVLPDGGVTIIPDTDPTSSANTEYVEGSRIEVSFSVKMYTSPDVISAGVTADMYNLVELWKSGASSIYDRGFNSIKHSYNLSGSYVPTQIHAYGYGTNMDWYSADGGISWSQYEGNTTQKTVAAAIDTITTSGGYLSTNAVGPLQNDDIYLNTTSFFGTRISQNPANSQHKLTWTDSTSFGGGIRYRSGNVTYTGYKNSMLSLEASPHTGGNGAGYTIYTGSSLGQIMTGSDGDIFYANTWQPAYNNSAFFYYRENVPGLLKTLYSNYSNQKNGANTYTAMICGQTGTILKSNRTYNSTGTWQSKPTYLSKSDGAGGWIKDTTKPLLSDLYSIAGDDSTPSGFSKWVAVGQYGIIMVSVNDGEDWVQIPSPVTSNLNAVRYCNGTWVAVGDSYKTPGGDVRCTILTASNPLGTWTQIQETSFDTSLNYIDYSYDWDRINVAGQGIILTSSGSSISFSAPSSTNFGPTETYDLTRLTYYGSWPLVTDTNLPPPEQRILNGQIFSATVVDSQYVAGQETTYYLVIGNMAQRPVYAGQVFLQVTEVKR